MVNEVSTTQRLTTARFNLDSDIAPDNNGLLAIILIFNNLVIRYSLVNDKKEEIRKRSTNADTDSVSPSARKMILEHKHCAMVPHGKCLPLN